MKNIAKISAIALLALSINTAIAGPKDTGKFQANAAKTSIGWNGKKVTGEHSGNVSLSSGAIVVDKGVLKGGSFVINMASITCTDLKDAEWNGKLVGHLKAEDFFNTAKFPTAQFVITSVAPGAAGKYTIKGNLTIKGITKPIEFPAAVTVSGKTLMAAATITVDRTKYDIKYGSKSFFESIGDKAIHDDFTLDLKLVAEAK